MLTLDILFVVFLLNKFHKDSRIYIKETDY